MAFTYFGSTSSPADNGTSTATTITLTPPTSMTTGDLVYVSCWQRGTATFSVGVDGGQTWNTLTRHTGTNIAVQRFWCRYNGTWGANPRFDFSAGTNTNAFMVVFRPTGTSYLIGVDTAEANGTFTAGSTPFTKTITGHTRTNSSCVTLAGWFTADDNTWGTLSGTGWSKTSLSAQYRNTSGSDMSATFAYNIGSGATNNVSQNQATLGGDAGNTTIISFYEYEPAGQTYTETLESLLAVGDGTVRSAYRARMSADAFSVYDGGVTRAYVLLAGSGATLINNIVHALLRGRVAEDPIDVTDTGRTLHWAATLSDGASLGDDKTAVYIQPGTTFEETKDDSISLLDAQARSLALTRQLDDSFPLADEALRSVLRNRLAESTVALIDEAIKTVISSGYTYTETLQSLLDVTDTGRTLYWQTLLTDVAAIVDENLSSTLRNRHTADAIALADEALRSALRGRLLGDEVVVADALFKALFYTRTATDSATITDELLASIVGGATIYRTASDEFNLYDNYGSTRKYDVTAGSGIPVTDDKTATFVSGDSGTTYTSTRTSELSATDSALKSAHRNRLASDALTLDDSGRDATFTVLSTDHIALVDALEYLLTGGGITSVTLTSNIDVTDTGRTFYWDARYTDGLVVADSTVKSAQRNRRTEDTIGVTDSELHQWLGSIVMRTATDGVLVTDDGRTIYWQIRRSSAADVTDVASAAVSQPFLVTRRMTEEIRVGDQLVRVMLRQRYITDTTPVYDHVGRMPREVVLLATDEQPLSDLFNFTQGPGANINARTLSDAVILTDVGRTFYTVVTRSEYMQVYDQLLYTAGEFNAIFRSASDVLTLTDQIFRRLVKQRLLTDGVSLLDASYLGHQREIVATAVEEIAITDQAPRTVFMRRALLDAIALADEIIGGAQASTYTQVLTDELSLADQAQRTVRAVRLAQDTVRVIDEVLWQTFASGNIYGIQKDDSLDLSDALFRSATHNRMADDSFELQSELLKQRLLYRGLFDSVEVGDGLIRVRWMTRTLSDYLGLTDEQIARYIPYLPYVYHVRINLGTGDPIAVLLATSDIRVLGMSDVAVLDALADNPLASSTRVYLGGYN